MPKKARRAVPADIWLQRATAAQVEKMKTALGVVEAVTKALVENATDDATKPSGQLIKVHDHALPEGQRDVTWPQLDFSPPVAYVIESCPVRGGVLSYRLLKVKIAGGVVVSIEAGLENLREIVLRDIEDHILRDA